MRYGMLLLLAIALLPVAAGFDCSKTTLYDQCVSIQSSNLTQDERDLLLVNLLSNTHSFPNHALVLNWNQGLNTSSPPENQTIVQSTYITDAWMTLLGVMPSVVKEGVLLVPSTVTIQSACHYNLTLPQNFQAASYPQTSQGDCKRTYQVQTNTATLQVFDGSTVLGSNISFAASPSFNATLHAVYDIVANILIKHYAWRSYCCRREHGGCVRWCGQCNFKRNEVSSDRVTLHDYLNTTTYQPPQPVELQLLSRYGSSTAAFFAAHDQNVLLATNESHYTENHYYYDLLFTKRPYYVLQVQARPQEASLANNTNLANTSLIFRGSNCTLTATDFFTTTTTPCNETLVAEPLNISTDKLIYDVGEPVRVTVVPANLSVVLQYGNITFNTTGEAQLTATPYDNTLTAVAGQSKAITVIHVQTTDPLGFVAKGSAFCLLNYLFYVLLKRYWGVLLG